MGKSKTLVAVLLSSLLFSAACATKKFVQAEVGTARSEITSDVAKKNEEQDAKIQEQAGQVAELSNLNRQVSGRVDTLTQRTQQVEQKADQAQQVGTEARTTAQQALSTAKDVSRKFENRANYQQVESQELLFKFNSAKLSAEATAALDSVAAKLGRDKMLLLELQGYTDAVGDDQYNLRLSDARVNSVIRYLVETGKVELHRIYTLGLGEANPVGDNKTRQGRDQNRRVTVRILGLAG